jgi:hypothetical protein
MRSPNRLSARVEAKVLAARRRRHRGAVVLAADLGLNASVAGTGPSPRCHCCPRSIGRVAPLSSPLSGVRYEHPRPGDMIHVDVKNSSGSRQVAVGACTDATRRSRSPTGTRRSRSATTTGAPQSMTTPSWPTPKYYPTRKTSSAPRCRTARCGGSPSTASESNASSPTFKRWSTGTAAPGPQCASHGNSTPLHQTRLPLDQRQSLELFNRTLIREWAYARAWTSNHSRPRGLETFLNYYNT